MTVEHIQSCVNDVITHQTFIAQPISRLMRQLKILDSIPIPRDHRRYFYFLFNNGHRERFTLPTGMRGAAPALLINELLKIIIKLKSISQRQITGEFYLYEDDHGTEVISQYVDCYRYYSHVCELIDGERDLLEDLGVWRDLAEKYNYPDWLMDRLLNK